MKIYRLLDSKTIETTDKCRGDIVILALNITASICFEIWGTFNEDGLSLKCGMKLAFPKIQLFHRGGMGMDE